MEDLERRRRHRGVYGLTMITPRTCLKRACEERASQIPRGARGKVRRGSNIDIGGVGDEPYEGAGARG